jgi:hypothetical protein
MKEITLGYDVREMWYLGDHWAPPMDGLPRKGLCIEPSIWGSVFMTGDCPGIVGEDRKDYGLGSIPLPEMQIVGLNMPLWSRLQRMQDYLKTQNAKSQKCHYIIAITFCGQDPERTLRERTEWPYYCETVPSVIGNDWDLLGYDVTSCYSESVISGLFVPDAEQASMSHFETILNEHALFSEVADADRFRTALDVSWPDESPHLIYGIWRIAEILL